MSRLPSLGFLVLFLSPGGVQAVPKDHTKKLCEHLTTQTVRNRCCDEHKQQCDNTCIYNEFRFACLDECQIQMNVCKGRPEDERPGSKPGVTLPKAPGGAVQTPPRGTPKRSEGSLAPANSAGSSRSELLKRHLPTTTSDEPLATTAPATNSRARPQHSNVSESASDDQGETVDKASRKGKGTDRGPIGHGQPFTPH